MRFFNYDDDLTPQQNYEDFVEMFYNEQPRFFCTPVSLPHIDENKKKYIQESEMFGYLLNDKATDQDYINFIVVFGSLRNLVNWESMKNVYESEYKGVKNNPIYKE